MKHIAIALSLLGISAVIITGAVYYKHHRPPEVLSEAAQPEEMYWFLLHRESNIQYLYYGVPNQLEQSKLIRTFTVKTGRPGERPTPLPELVGREYWLVTAKTAVTDNPETAPYFITLDIPAPSEPPYGPAPYLECGGQCDWIIYGEFGLHGVNGDLNRLSADDPGSSGCIRHTDEDITFLYNLLKPDDEEIRYYIKAI